MDEPSRRRVLIRDAVRFSSFAGAGICVVFVVLGWVDLAIATALGTLVGVLNFVLLARGVSNAIDRTVAAVVETQRERGDPSVALDPEAVVHRPRSAGGVARMAVVAAALAGLLLAAPSIAQPAGLAIGVIVVLIAASASGLRHERA